MATAEVYVQLAVNYASNRKLRKLIRFGSEARAARDLYVQMICHCKDNLTDGFVPADEIGILVYPDAPDVGERDARRLVEVGLCSEVADGWLVTGYLERNPSKEDVHRMTRAKSAGAQRANHRRWHEQEGLSDSGCVFCQTSDQTTDPSADQRSDQYAESDRVGTPASSDSTETETESETKTETTGPACGSDDDPDFVAFWDVYPRKASKGAARRAWRTAIRTVKADPKKIILAAERLRDHHVAAGTLKKYIPHPSTWLNGECWNDEPDTGKQEVPARFTYPTSPWAN